jgi:hypothetical protein
MAPYGPWVRNVNLGAHGAVSYDEPFDLLDAATAIVTGLCAPVSAIWDRKNKCAGNRSSSRW